MYNLLQTAITTLVRARWTFVLLVIAVATCVGFQISSTANIDGFTHELMQKGVVSNTGHLVIVPSESQLFDDVSSKVASLGISKTKGKVTARLRREGVLLAKGNTTPAKFVGIDVDSEDNGSGICSRIETGMCSFSETVVLGGLIAELLNLNVGDPVSLVIPYKSGSKTAYSRAKLEVAGILAQEGYPIIDNGVFVERALLSERLRSRDGASSIHVWLEDPSTIDHMAATLRSKLESVKVLQWKEVNAFVKGAIEGNETLASVSGTMIFFAVLIPVLALLFIHTMQERKNIVILCAIGFTRRAIFTLYLMKAAFVGMVGTILGTGLGIALCNWFIAHPIFSHNGFVVRPLMTPAVVIMPVVLVFTVTVLGGVIPALHAAGTNHSQGLKEL